jgi:hypothetical protein
MAEINSTEQQPGTPAHYAIAAIVMGNEITMHIENESTGEAVVKTVAEIINNSNIIKHMTPEDALSVGVWHGEQRRRELIRSFTDSRIILAQPGDERLVTQSDAPVSAQQAHDEPIYLVIAATAPDDALERASERFGIPLQKLRQFRGEIAHA